nr:MAG TPA: hypothetical protein [Bacteriophage sp.]DAX99869.1 MAG TPA: hypothetical protein [Caudoviricetes sp.]
MKQRRRESLIHWHFEILSVRITNYLFLESFLICWRFLNGTGFNPHAVLKSSSEL